MICVFWNAYLLQLTFGYWNGTSDRVKKDAGSRWLANLIN